MKKFGTIAIVILVLVIAISVYVRFFYVFADGTKAGVLNTFQKKGYVFKTYEGKIIQSGFRQNIQSNEFSFSVTSERVAEQLLHNPGKEIVLHYKSYFGRLPWRGMQTFVVDSIYEIREDPFQRGLVPQK